MKRKRRFTVLAAQIEPFFLVGPSTRQFISDRKPTCAQRCVRISAHTAIKANARASPRFPSESHGNLLLQRDVQREKLGARSVQSALQLKRDTVADEVEEAFVGARAPDGMVDGADGGVASVGLEQRGNVDNGQNTRG
jgi:hypothetical protein